MTERKHRYCDLGFYIPIFFCILLAVFSPFMVYRYQAFLSVLLLFLWLILCVANRKKWTASEICTIFFFSYLVVMPYIMGYRFVSNRYLVLAFFIMGNLISSYCEYTNKWEQIGIVLKCALPFVVYVYLKTFIGLLAHPWITRMIKLDDAYTVQARLQGVGGYEFIYFLAMIVSISMGLFFLMQKRRYKWICLAVSILSYVEVILSNYMTALLIATIGAALTILLFLVKRSRAWMVFIIFCITVLVIFGNSLMHVAVDILLKVLPENGMTSLRLQKMQGSFWQMMIAEFLSDRGPTLEKSFRCFLQYPFFGIIGQSGFSQQELFSKIGQHSYFLDTFAFYGGAVGILSLHNYFSLFRKKYFDKDLLMITLPVLVCGATLLLFNNVTISIGVVTGFIYPYALYLVRKQTEHNKIKV